MRTIDLQYAFLAEINKLDSIVDVPASVDIEYWLNQALLKFIKTRFTGDNVKGTSFESNEKRINDLRTLIKEVKHQDLKIVESNGIYEQYNISLPIDFLYCISETVGISNKEGLHKRLVDVFECTSDNLNTRMNNTLTDFHYHNHYARPLRVIVYDTVQLYTDCNYNIDTYKLKYIKYPCKIDLHGNSIYNEYCDLTEDLLQEVVKIATQMYIENQSDKRYQTIVNEVNTIE